MPSHDIIFINVFLNVCKYKYRIFLRRPAPIMGDMYVKHDFVLQSHDVVYFVLQSHDVVYFVLESHDVVYFVLQSHDVVY